jgi:hypothetical protein
MIYDRQSRISRLSPWPTRKCGELGLNRRIILCGDYSYRRFRITKPETAEVQATLQHTWSGHAKSHVSKVYKKLLKQREWPLAMGRKSRYRLYAARPPAGSGGDCKWHVWQDFGIPKSRLSSLESGWTRGIRTPGLLVANSGENKLRQGATIT